MKEPTKKDLMKNIGKSVDIKFKDGTTACGILGYTKEFSARYGYRKPNMFTINDIDFRVSHILCYSLL